MAAATLATALKWAFFVLGFGMLSLFIYTLLTDPLINFFRELIHTPWMIAAFVELVVHLIPISLWIIYKESNWILSWLRIVSIMLVGSMVACGYILINLVELSPQESKQDPLFHLLLSKKKDERRSNGILSVTSARVLFSFLAIVMAGTFICTAIIDGSPFRSGIFTPWFIPVLVDAYIRAIIISVWIAYKEPSWISAAVWIVLVMCLGGVVSSTYIVLQLFRLSPQDPIFLIFFNDRARDGNAGISEALI